MKGRKITLKHRLPDGTVASRWTARAYSHVVIARHDLVKIRAEAGRLSKVDCSNFAYYQKQIAAGVGGTYSLGNDLMSSPLSQADYDRAVERVAGCETAEQYAEKCRDERLAAHDARYGTASAGEWFVEGWCGRADLAEKLASRCRASNWCRRDVQVQAINDGN